ncbi:hypothetical protein I552_4048 [Mycobacterium xenopi 3993]|nr:hypothetical protein I552_4048 [Mycobacterium xenopi 3993]
MNATAARRAKTGAQRLQHTTQGLQHRWCAELRRVIPPASRRT